MGRCYGDLMVVSGRKELSMRQVWPYIGEMIARFLVNLVWRQRYLLRLSVFLDQNPAVMR